MSLKVFVIGAAHAVPIVLVAALSGSRVASIVTAVVMVWVAVQFGGSRYIGVDLLFVAIGLVLAFIWTTKTPKLDFQLAQPIPPAAAPPALQVEKPPPAPEKKEDDYSWVSGIVIFVIVATYFYNKVTDKPEHSPPAQVQQQTYVPPKQEQPPRAERPVETRKHSAAIGNRGNSDLRQCLNLPTDAEIIRCANQGRKFP